MFTKKFLSLVLAMGLAIGFSLDAGALLSVVDQDVLKIFNYENEVVVNQEVLKVFNCENEEELEYNLKLPAYVGIVAKSFDKLPSEIKSSPDVSELCKQFIEFSEMVHSDPSITVESSDNYNKYRTQRDKVINELAKVIRNNGLFKNEFSKIITGGLSLNDRSVRGKSRRHPGYGSLDG